MLRDNSNNLIVQTVKFQCLGMLPGTASFICVDITNMQPSLKMRISRINYAGKLR